jgi:rubredoxin
MDRQQTLVCMLCMHIYSEAEGDPVSGFPPGTLWEELPSTWRCPRCGAAKGYFENEALFSQRDPGTPNPEGYGEVGDNKPTGEP